VRRINWRLRVVQYCDSESIRGCIASSSDIRREEQSNKTSQAVEDRSRSISKRQYTVGSAHSEARAISSFRRTSLAIASRSLTDSPGLVRLLAPVKSFEKQ